MRKITATLFLGRGHGMLYKTCPHASSRRIQVVLKLFHIVEPHMAFFGKKDFQQLRVVQRMVRDLDLAITVVGGDICREEDGLAMSRYSVCSGAHACLTSSHPHSRNALLTKEHRERAPVIRSALLWAASQLSEGACEAEVVKAEVARRVEEGGGRVDYVEVRELDNLVPVVGVVARPVLVAVAAQFGNVRLIDNIEIAVA